MWKALQYFVESFLGNLSVKEYWKSVYICRSYDQKSSVLFFLRHSVELHSAELMIPRRHIEIDTVSLRDQQVYRLTFPSLYRN